MTAAFNYKYEVFNPIFAGFNNETLYNALCAATAPLNEGLEELSNRLRPIVLNAARGFLTALSWTFDDAKGEALILIWELVRKQSYKAGGAPFHKFFSRCWELRLNDKFAKTAMRTPIMLGNCKVGIAKDKPIEVCGYGWHEKAEEYRRKKADQQARWDAKRREKLGLPPKQPKKPPMTEEEKREKRRIRSAERFASLTPEEKRAQYDRSNARRKAKRDAEKAARMAVVA